VHHLSLAGRPAGKVYTSMNHSLPSMLFQTGHQTADFYSGYNWVAPDFLNKKQKGNFLRPGNRLSSYPEKTL
jgi:hypothetical protein